MGTSAKIRHRRRRRTQKHYRALEQSLVAPAWEGHAIVSLIEPDDDVFLGRATIREIQSGSSILFSVTLGEEAKVALLERASSYGHRPQGAPGWLRVRPRYRTREYLARCHDPDAHLRYVAFVHYTYYNPFHRDLGVSDALVGALQWSVVAPSVHTQLSVVSKRGIRKN